MHSFYGQGQRSKRKLKAKEGRRGREGEMDEADMVTLHGPLYCANLLILILYVRHVTKSIHLLPLSSSSLCVYKKKTVAE